MSSWCLVSRIWNLVVADNPGEPGDCVDAERSLKGVASPTALSFASLSSAPPG